MSGGSHLHSISPRVDHYVQDHFIIGVDTERVIDGAITGLNTKAGNMICLKVEGANAELASVDVPTEVFVVLHSDNILEIRDSGASVYD